MENIDLATLVVVLAPLAIVLHWFVDLGKDVTNRNANGVLTKLFAFAGGFLLVFLAAHSSIDFGNGVLPRLSWTDELLLGLLVAATGGTVIENGLKAINRADTSTTAKLVPAKASTLDDAAAQTAMLGEPADS